MEEEEKTEKIGLCLFGPTKLQQKVGATHSESDPDSNSGDDGEEMETIVLQQPGSISIEDDEPDDC